jgi:flagellar biosynthetic protein FliR
LGAQTTAISRLYEVAVPTLILSSGLYRVLISALVGSYQVIPPGTLVAVSDGVPAVVLVVANSFDLALRIATPFILASLAWNVAMGLIARLVPRLPVYFVALPGQIALGLLLLAACGTAMISAWTETIRTDLGTLPGAG